MMMVVVGLIGCKVEKDDGGGWVKHISYVEATGATSGV